MVMNVCGAEQQEKSVQQLLTQQCCDKPFESGCVRFLTLVAAEDDVKKTHLIVLLIVLYTCVKFQAAPQLRCNECDGGKL